MPPIFGILNTHLHQPNPEMVSRMRLAVHYIKHRNLESLEITGGYMATAVAIENQLVSDFDTITVKKQWAIIADASLYKQKELLEKMGKVGEKEKRRGGDVTLILEAWFKWGEECIQHLYGDFAFVIFNQQTGEVFCGRDPMGIRPLFYAFIGDIFVFSSELRYVMASFKASPILRHEYLLDTLVTIKSSKELSPFENIFKLKPGNYLHRSEGDTQLHQYWQVDPEKRIRLSSEEDYINMFHEKLVRAVNMRCAGVLKLGSELSGGLDSSAVAGNASDFANKSNISFTAFSNLFPLNTGIKFKDEREFVEDMLAFKTIDWVGVDKSNHDIPEMLQYTNDIQGCFVQQNFNVFNRDIYERAGERGMQVLLSGFGGDEMVSARIAIPWNELIGERRWKVMADELFYKGITLRTLLKAGLITTKYIKSRIYQPKYRTGVFTPELLDRRFAQLPLQPVYASLYELRKRLGDNFIKPWQNKVSVLQNGRIMQDHIPQRMEYCYTAAAQYGLEYRYPLLDLDLMETYLAFPPWVKQHHGINRYVFRQAIKGYVPEEIRQRNDKSGSTIPQIHYSLIQEKDLIMDLIKSCSVSPYLNEIFDFSRFPQWYERLVKRDNADMNYLMPGAFYNYLMIMLYFKKYG